VKVHDFEEKELGKVVPYGVYDVGANAGWVSVGVTSDTAQFAVASIRRWLDAMGRERYPKARELTITADGGGSNGTRVRLWKVELQRVADETGLVLHVHHYPPGTSIGFEFASGPRTVLPALRGRSGAKGSRLFRIWNSVLRKFSNEHFPQCIDCLVSISGRVHAKAPI
jgi:hypothetical protein